MAEALVEALTELVLAEVLAETLTQVLVEVVLPRFVLPQGFAVFAVFGLASYSGGRVCIF